MSLNHVDEGGIDAAKHHTEEAVGDVDGVAAGPEVLPEGGAASGGIVEAELHIDAAGNGVAVDHRRGGPW